VKDYSYGNYSCDNRFIEPKYEKVEFSRLLSEAKRNTKPSATRIEEEEEVHNSIQQQNTSGQSTRRRP
jgi:hypothetical protein